MTPRVDQYVQTFRARDAVSDEARLFRDRLRERGFAATIYAAGADDAVAGDVEPYDPARPVGADAVLYHHATVADVGRRLARWAGRKALLYHGVTPPELMRPYQPLLAALLEEGRATLRAIAPRFAAHYADSAFGAGELRAIAGTAAEVLPFCLDARRFASGGVGRPAWPADGGTRWLTVGRVAPNKGLLALVAAFAAYGAANPAATLAIVGEASVTDPYFWAVRAAIDAAGLRGRVRMTGSVDDAALVRAYADADVYVCLSEHEGFCVPLVEAMRFDVPVVALARGAVPETLGGAGLLLGTAEPAGVAAAVDAVCRDYGRRTAILAGQRARAAIFAPERTLAAFDRAVDALLGP